jgi:serine/threonine-protein kinase
VGLAGLLYAVSYLSFDLLFSYLRMPFAREYAYTFYPTMVCAVGSGLGLYWLSRKPNLDARLVLRLGLWFEVLASFLIAIAETKVPLEPHDLLRGHSAIAMWIPTYGLLAPSPFRTTLAVSFAAAAMAPLGMAVNVALGNTVPNAGQWVTYAAGPLIMAGVTAFASRWVYRLSQELRAAREMGGYELLGHLGKGAMGEVWHAKHRFLAREAAVKLIAPNPHGDRTMQEARFTREARAISRLESPHTVSIYDFGSTPEGRLYFAMELIRGVNLDQYVKRFGPMPPERVRHVLLGVLNSLEEAHGAGLTHRDIKPSNILLGRLGLEHDFVKVVDFGLVKSIAAGDGQLTADQQAIGTPAFMAPEIARGESEGVDGRADLYSLACVADWLLTGVPLFDAKTPVALLLKHANETPRRMVERSEAMVPEEFEDLLRRCLAKQASERPADCATLRQELLELPMREWTQAKSREWWRTHLPELAA